MYDDDFDICTSISTQQPMGKEVHISVTWSATCPVNLRFFAAQPAPSRPKDIEKMRRPRFCLQKVTQEFPLYQSGLRICNGLGCCRVLVVIFVGHSGLKDLALPQLQLWFNPWLETSISLGCDHKKKVTWTEQPAYSPTGHPQRSQMSSVKDKPNSIAIQKRTGHLVGATGYLLGGHRLCLGELVSHEEA